MGRREQTNRQRLKKKKGEEKKEMIQLKRVTL